MRTRLAKIDASDPRLNAGVFVLAIGSLICLFDFTFALLFQTPSIQVVSLLTGLIMLALVPILLRYRTAEAVFGVASLIAIACTFAPFLSTGNTFFLSCGFCIPIGATFLGGIRLGWVVCILFSLTGLLSAIALQENWITPLFPKEHLSRGLVIDTIVYLLIMIGTWGAAVWVERNRQHADAKRSESDVWRQKQLAGLRLLAKATEDILPLDAQPEHWSDLLNGSAKHLNCDLLTNYELEGEQLHLRASIGLPAELLCGYEVIKLGQKLCGHCALTRKLLCLQGNELKNHDQGSELAAMGFRAVIVTPLIYGSQLVGTLAFGSTLKDRFSSDEIDFIKMVGLFVASVRGRTLANRATDEAFKRLEKLASRLPGTVYQFRYRPDGTFCFPYASARMFEIHGIHPKEIMEDGSVALSFHHPDDTAPLMAKIKESAMDLSPFNHEFRLRFPDGEVRWVSVNSIPEREADGSTLFHSYSADITERIQSQQSLIDAHLAAETANRAKSEFLANMSHEIRTPMAAILGYADILATCSDEDLTQPTKTECLEMIKRNGEHLLLIINDILDISKIEADKLLVEQIAMSPLQVAQDVVELMKLKAEAKGLGLELKFQSPIPKTIQSDPTRLKQILMNLVSNAVKFTQQGQVTLVIRMDNEDRSQICFDVIDTGIGIQEERFSRLFQPFEQADASTTRKFGGTGLGLRISKRLSEILGGNIGVISDFGVGSCFSVKIPTGSLRGVPWISEDRNTAPRNERRIDPSKTTSLQNHPQSLKGLRILLVEDGLDNQKLLSFLLRKAGATVNIVDDGKQAVELLCIDGTIDGELHSPAQFDIVLMDMQMPQMDGYQATKLLRSKGFRLPILALTAHAMDSERGKCLAAGCDVWLTKPIETSQLISVCYQWGFQVKQVV